MRQPGGRLQGGKSLRTGASHLHGLDVRTGNIHSISCPNDFTGYSPLSTGSHPIITKVVGGKQNTELMLADSETETNALANIAGIRCQ